MDIPPYPAISSFCRIVSDLPEDTRRMVLGFLGMALGYSAEPTGIPFSPDRPLKHLYWDHTTKQLYDRLVYLVDDVAMKEQLVVQGAVAFITTQYSQWADVDGSQRKVGGFRQTIQNMEAELAIPIEQRDGKRSDEEINDFIASIYELIESAETRRQDAQELSEGLKAQFEAAFTLQFWDALNLHEAQKRRPEIDRFLGRGDDEEELSP